MLSARTGTATARGRTVPLLTDKHREWRKEWAGERVDEDWAAWVDLDEKWFYAMAPWRTHKLPPGMQAPLTPIQHKSHIPKVMHLTALGRPRAWTSAWSRGRIRRTHQQDR